jgi:hypothetical protein
MCGIGGSKYLNNEMLKKVKASRLSISGFGFRVSGFGFRVSGFGFRVSGLRFRVWGEGGSKYLYNNKLTKNVEAQRSI